MKASFRQLSIQADKAHLPTLQVEEFLLEKLSAIMILRWAIVEIRNETAILDVVYLQ